MKAGAMIQFLYFGTIIALAQSGTYTNKELRINSGRCGWECDIAAS